jgi:hypothetical protein
MTPLAFLCGFLVALGLVAFLWGVWGPDLVRR